MEDTSANSSRAHTLNALSEFVKTVTVPILCDSSPGIDQIGTGTLFSIDQRYFLITAAHLFNDVHPKNIAIPRNHNRDMDIKTLGCLNIYKADRKNIDIAAIELLEPDTINNLKGGWRILDLSNISDPSEIGSFALCGYPSSLSKRKENLVSGSLVCVYTDRLLQAPEDAQEPVENGLDLFFLYDTEAQDSIGNMTPTPHLGGTSGASVWEFRDSDKFPWIPEKVFKIVGVQSAFKKGKYFRAMSWSYVLRLLSKIDDDIKHHIEK